MPLAHFHPIITEWFKGRFGSPTDVQARSWPAILPGADVLIAAPTGSGKTLAAFLSCIDKLFRPALSSALEDRTHVLYVSPLKALSNDVQKNLQQPLQEIADAALDAGLLMQKIRVTVRTGDTPMRDRQLMLKRPPHILITTPESLYLLLTTEKSRKMLQDVHTVIVDEIHAVAPNKRGAHLALSLERLDAVAHKRPVRIGLERSKRKRRANHTAGRWFLLRMDLFSPPTAPPKIGGELFGEQVARQLLKRYGVVFRELLGREPLSLAWRDLLVRYRRMEFRGEIRGGRFVDGFIGEQFALPEAVESLRALRRAGAGKNAGQDIRISAADPLNLAGIILPGARVPANPNNYVLFRDGAIILQESNDASGPATRHSRAFAEQGMDSGSRAVTGSWNRR